jgi:ComF family protein
MMLRKFWQSFLALVYPPQCLQCRGQIRQPEVLFCESCSSLLEILESQGRCNGCFSARTNLVSGLCTLCEHRPLYFSSVAAAYDYVGPAARLVKCLKYANMPFLAKGAAASMVTQMSLLDWPLPDLIVPVPIAWNHWLERGYNQSYLIAKAMGKLLSVPVYDQLTRKSGDYSQAGLSLEQRLQLSGSRINKKKGAIFRSKNILLVDDVITTGSTLFSCAEVLKASGSKSLRAITLCQAIR